MNETINLSVDALKALAWLVHQLRDPDETEPWRQRAACRATGVNPAWFFPASPNPPASSPMLRRARGVCGGCPVKVACLEVGLRTTDAIYAGTTPAQRRAVRHMGYEQAMHTLLAQTRELSTTGTWRTVLPAEWEGESVG